MVIADTGFFVAMAAARDSHHIAAVGAFARLRKRGFVTTWPVISETCHLLAARADLATVDRFLEGIEFGSWRVVELPRDAVPRLRELMAKYRSLPMDLADASLVLLAEELGVGDIVSTDRRDFGVYRFKNHKPFRNLLLK
jgi:uncharacterized protein